MAGLSIPIGGDMAPFMAVVAELRAEMQKMGDTVKRAMAPVKAAGAESYQAMAQARQGAVQAQGGFRGLITSAGNLGFSLANIVQGAKAIRSAFNFIKSLPPVWRKVAIAVAGAGAAIYGVFTALKVLKSAFTAVLNFANKTWRGIKSGAASAASGIRGLFSSITSAVPGGGLFAPLAGVAGLIGGIALAFTSLKTGANVAGDIERTTIALQALTGSGEIAENMMEEMKATWLRTGASIEEQSGSIRKFVALGFSPDAAMQLQRNLMDVGGAVGMTTSETALLASALAQVKAKGVVSMEELRQQIAEKGIPVFEVLAQKLGVTKAALIDMVSAGKVPADQLLDIFMNMEGSFAKFKGGADRMGFTFVGMVSRLKGAWKLFLAEFAAPIIDNIKPLLASAMEKIESLKAKAREMGQVIGKSLLAAFALIKTGRTVDLMRTGFNFAIASAMDLLMRGLKSAVAFIANALPPVFDAALKVLSDPNFWKGIGLLLEAAANKMGSIIARAIGENGRADAMDGRTQMLSKLGTQQIQSSAAKDVDIGAILTDALMKGGEAAAAAFGKTGENAKRAQDEFKSVLASVKDVAAKMKEATAVPKVEDTGETTGGGDAISTPTASKKPFETLTTALGRIGGGGFGISFSPMIAQQQQANKLLTQISKNTSNMGKTAALPVI